MIRFTCLYMQRVPLSAMNNAHHFRFVLSFMAPRAVQAQLLLTSHAFKSYVWYYFLSIL